MDFVWRVPSSPAVPFAAAAGYLVFVHTYSLWGGGGGAPKTGKPAAAGTTGIPWLPVLHNAVIALWSLVMFVGAVWMILGRLRQERDGESGFRRLYCDGIGDAFESELEYAWLGMYHVSKYYELIDTVILLRRGRPLIFLHWFHHSLIVPVSWLWVVFRMRFGVIGMAVNTLVHVFMYTFYAASGLEPWARAHSPSVISTAVLHVTTVWKRRITTFQIVQFVSSFVMTIPYVYYSWPELFDGSLGPVRWAQPRCHGLEPFLLSVCMNSAFLVLFVRFFLKSYQTPRAKKE
jgi:fatty acid elongase 3